MIAARAFGFAAGMVELMARGMHPQKSISRADLGPRLDADVFRAIALYDRVDQKHAQSESGCAPSDLNGSISGEPPIDHSSMSI